MVVSVPPMARIALDIDSTLHHHWPLLERIVRERFGLSLPYQEQREWGIAALAREQVAACVEETHSDENILAAVPYPGAVETVGAWRAAGHWIHVTSHRAARTRRPTEAWLRRIGLPYDDLHLSFDKVSRCVELGVDLLVDDSPVNIARARGQGIAAATLAHPWNEHLDGRDGIIVASDWRRLRARVAAMLAAR